MTSKVLVTGGAGFLGSHLCERLLERGNEVVCVDDLSTSDRSNVGHLEGNEGFQFHIRDVTKPLFMMRLDEIFHLACPASPVHYQRDPVRTIRTAVQGTMNVLDLARSTDARVTIASTSEVYGDPLEHPQQEGYWGNANPIGPRSCYDEGKRCAEALASSYAQQYGVDVRTARIFNTYGPRMRIDDGRVIPSFVSCALRDEPLVVHGDGTQTRSFCYVSDLIEGLLRLSSAKPPPGPVNLGNPCEVSIGFLAARVIDLTHSKSKMKTGALPIDDPRRRCPDIARARDLLAWQPEVALRDGLERVIQWQRNEFC